MNIVYLSQIDISLADKGIYADLINSLKQVGHSITIVSATSMYDTGIDVCDGVKVVRVKTGQQYGVNFIKKGIVMLSIERKVISAIRKYLLDETFDLVLYATPPVTLANVVKYCKKKYRCKSYLMLKDIFPQNALDIGIMKTSGIMGIIYKKFRADEKRLYKISDKIGCMSEANVQYVLANNSVESNKIEVFPNAVLTEEINNLEEKDKNLLVEKGIDSNLVTFIYGGNLGKPQGLNFLAEGIKACAGLDCNFVVVGSGQEKANLFSKLKDLPRVYAYDYLPHEIYKKLCSACDVGLIMLDYRFTIPNYPSRILTYMENAMPMFACTDKVTDIKTLIEEQAQCGKWCFSNDIDAFVEQIKWFIENKDKLEDIGKNGRKFMENNFNTDICVEKLERLFL